MNTEKQKEFLELKTKLLNEIEYRVARFNHRFEQCKKCQYIKQTSI